MPAAHEYVVLSNRGRLLYGPTNNGIDAQTKARELGGYVQFVMNEERDGAAELGDSIDKKRSYLQGLTWRLPVDSAPLWPIAEDAGISRQRLSDPTYRQSAERAVRKQIANASHPQIAAYYANAIGEVDVAGEGAEERKPCCGNCAIGKPCDSGCKNVGDLSAMGDIAIVDVVKQKHIQKLIIGMNAASATAHEASRTISVVIPVDLLDSWVVAALRQSQGGRLQVEHGVGSRAATVFFSAEEFQAYAMFLRDVLADPTIPENEKTVVHAVLASSIVQMEAQGGRGRRSGRAKMVTLGRAAAECGCAHAAEDGRLVKVSFSPMPKDIVATMIELGLQNVGYWRATDATRGIIAHLTPEQVEQFKAFMRDVETDPDLSKEDKKRLRMYLEGAHYSASPLTATDGFSEGVAEVRESQPTFPMAVRFLPGQVEGWVSLSADMAGLSGSTDFHYDAAGSTLTFRSRRQLNEFLSFLEAAYADPELQDPEEKRKILAALLQTRDQIRMQGSYGAAETRTADVLYERRAPVPGIAPLSWHRGRKEGSLEAQGNLGKYRIYRRQSNKRRGIYPIVLEKGNVELQASGFPAVKDAKAFADHYEAIWPVAFIQAPGDPPGGAPPILVLPAAPALPAPPAAAIPPAVQPVGGRVAGRPIAVAAHVRAAPGAAIPPAFVPAAAVAGVGPGGLPIPAPPPLVPARCGPFARIERNDQAFAACAMRAQQIGPIDTIEDVYRLVAPELHTYDQECILIVPLGVHGAFREVPVRVGEGERSKVMCDPADVLRAVILSGASSFWLVHVHPSGKAKPSSADKRLTETVRDAAFCAFGGKKSGGRVSMKPTVEFLGHAVIGVGEVADADSGKIVKVK